VIGWLVALTVVWIAIGALTRPSSQGWDEWTSGIATGLGTGTAAAVLTFLLIDMMLGRQRQEESRESSEQERLGTLLAKIRVGERDENRGVLEEMRSAGWLKNGQLRKADFSGANLGSLDFGSADLRGALFMGAQLRGASFRNADVSTARFNKADLRGARFDGADMTDTDFTMARSDQETFPFPLPS
jgi:hypothetical protein